MGQAVKIRITILIPLLLVFSTFVATFVIFVETKRVAVERIKQETRDKLILDITRLQNILYNLLTEHNDNLDNARLNLSVTAMDSQFKSLLLLGEDDVVLVASRYLWERQEAREVIDFDSRAAQNAKKQNSPQIYFLKFDASTLVGYFPVVLKLESASGLPVKRKGLLYAELTMRTKLQQAYRAALIESLGFGVFMLLLSLIVGVLLHLMVSRRLGRLALAARTLASGDLEARVLLGGDDELSQVGNSFNDMAKRIKQDISRRQVAEQRLRELNETLELRIAQRSIELEQKKQELLDSQAMAFHNNKLSALGEMASGIAHEINSPLQTISLLSYSLKKNSVSDQAILDCSGKIDMAVQKVTDIVESLRNMSRDSSRDPPEDALVKDIVADATGITTERYRINGVEFNVEYRDETEGIRIKCQRIRIGQILVNLLNNAFDAVMEQKKRWILLEVRRQKGMVSFLVSDSGAGIDANILGKVFEPMFTTKEIGKGTGLGLSLSLEIAKQHQGFLFLDTKASCTCFVLQLPLAVE